MTAALGLSAPFALVTLDPEVAEPPAWAESRSLRTPFDLVLAGGGLWLRQAGNGADRQESVGLDHRPDGAGAAGARAGGLRGLVTDPEDLRSAEAVRLGARVGVLPGDWAAGQAPRDIDAFDRLLAEARPRALHGPDDSRVRIAAAFADLADRVRASPGPAPRNPEAPRARTGATPSAKAVHDVR
jgi:hypothetical protein